MKKGAVAGWQRPFFKSRRHVDKGKGTEENKMRF